MLEFSTGNIFDSDCEAIINTVNCLGISGKGLALQFKIKYPQMYNAYRTACNNGEVKIGICHVWENSVNNPKFIINFPTKDDWRKPSKISYIVKGLTNLGEIIKDKNIKSTAIPALGCQNGGLQWTDVRILISKFASSLSNVKVVIYEPRG